LTQKGEIANDGVDCVLKAQAKEIRGTSAKI
jgi:hypothetical protein